MKDRRFNPRIEVDINCLIQYNGIEYTCNIIDISREGLALYSKEVCPTTDDSIDIIFCDTYENTIYGKVNANVILSAKVKNVTIVKEMFRIGVHTYDQCFMKYVDDKQAGLWVKANPAD